MTTKAEVQAEYDKLCKQRDETNARCAPIMAKLEEARNKSEEYRVKAMEAVTELRDARGGEAWRELKRHIRLRAEDLARMN